MEIIQTEDIAKRIKCDKLQDETAATALPLAPAGAPTSAALTPRVDPAALTPRLDLAANRIRSSYYNKLGIRRGGKQTKKKQKKNRRTSHRKRRTSHRKRRTSRKK